MTGLEEALHLYPELAVLVGLSHALWTFWTLTDSGGRPEWLIGVLNWPRHSDTLWISGRQHALAVRLFVDTPPGGVVWQFSGPLGPAINALLALPAPGTSDSPDRLLSPGPFWPPGGLR